VSSRRLAEKTLYEPRLQETLFTRRLACGLDISVLPRPGFLKKHATFMTRYGSVDSSFTLPGSEEVVEVPAGIAHFLEHEVFEEESGNAFETFAALGASANAFTTYTNTTYLFTTTQDFEKCLEFLLTFVGRLSLTGDKVEREKGIIEQELRMYEDIPRFKVQANLMQALFHNHPVRLDIGGTVQSVRAITKEQLELCHSTFYHPGNMVVFATGDLDPQEIMNLVEDVLSSNDVWDLAPRAQPRRRSPEEPHEVLKPRVSHKMLVSQPILNIGIKDVEPGLRGPEVLRKELLTGILLDILLGRGSDLYTSLYEEGLIDDKFSAGHMGEADYGVTIIGGQTPDPRRLEERLIQGFGTLGHSGLSEEDFQRIRKKAEGQFLGVIDQPEALAQAFNHHYLHGVGLWDFASTLQSLTFEEVSRRFSEFLDPRRRSVSVVLPAE
jgi:predicted Zn-dependent peptidase